MTGSLWHGLDELLQQSRDSTGLWEKVHDAHDDPRLQSELMVKSQRVERGLYCAMA